MVEGRGQNTANKSREGNYGCHVTVYKFALGLFGLQIDFIGSLQRIDCCGPSIGCMQRLVSLVLSSMEFHVSLQDYSKNMGSKQYGVDHLNMEINKFTVERKVYHRLNQSQFRISILVFFRVNFTGY